MTALAGVTLMAAALLGMAFADGFWTLFLLRMLLGCGANFLFVVAEAALNVFAPATHRGRVMGTYTAVIAFGFVLGPAIVAGMPDAPALLLLGCAAVTAVAVLPLRAARAPVDRFVRPTSLGRILPAIIAFPFAFGFVFVASAIDAVAISLLPVVALDQAFSIEAGALFVTVFHVGLLLGQPVVGTALDLFGRRRTVLACCLLSLACTATLCLGDGLEFWPVAGLMLAWGPANYGLYTAGLALIGDRYAGATLTAATAGVAAVYALASVISPVLAGQAIELVGAGGFYAVLAGIYLAALAGSMALFRPLEPVHVRR